MTAHSPRVQAMIRLIIGKAAEIDAHPVGTVLLEFAPKDVVISLGQRYPAERTTETLVPPVPQETL